MKHNRPVPIHVDTGKYVSPLIFGVVIGSIVLWQSLGPLIIVLYLLALYPILKFLHSVHDNVKDFQRRG
jgi:hypothetical protein